MSAVRPPSKPREGAMTCRVSNGHAPRAGACRAEPGRSSQTQNVPSGPVVSCLLPFHIWHCCARASAS